MDAKGLLTRAIKPFIIGSRTDTVTCITRGFFCFAGPCLTKQFPERGPQWKLQQHHARCVSPAGIYDSMSFTQIWRLELNFYRESRIVLLTEQPYHDACLSHICFQDSRCSFFILRQMPRQNRRQVQRWEMQQI